MEQIITTLITGNIGTAVIVLIFWKSGLLKYLLMNNKDIEYRNGQPLTTIREVADKMTRLERHYNHETTDILQGIRDELRLQNQKLDRVLENSIFIRARLNGKEQ